MARHRRPPLAADRAHPLAESYDQCLSNARALIGFCRPLGLPFGINVESLTNRKVEIEASVDLAREIRELLVIRRGHLDE